MFAALYSPVPDDAAALAAVAREFSPRVEQQLGGRLVLIDADGLGRIIGNAQAIHRELQSAVSRAAPRRVAHMPHVEVAVALAPTRTAALLLAAAGTTAVVSPGRTAAAVGALGLCVFEALAHVESQSRPRRRAACALCDMCSASPRRAPVLCGQPGGACTELPTLRRWGLATLADLAALPAAELAARFGQIGVALQRLARGADAQPLVPVVEETRFEASLDLEWPIEELQPLSFVLSRLLDPLSAALERADRGAAAIVTELTLVRVPHVRLKADATSAVDATSEADATSTVHVRRLELPAPMRDARVLRTLILLDLESHPPPAGIDRVAVRIEPTPGRIVQFSLLERAGPQPETIATLLSRLVAVVGDGRVGSPAIVDSHRPGAFALLPFAPSDGRSEARNERPEVRGERSAPVLRRFRLPVAARVALEGGRPVRVTTDRLAIRGGAVEQWAGPWRASGGWWCGAASHDESAEKAERAEAPSGTAQSTVTAGAWDRDEYDVQLSDGGAYRIYYERHEDRWFVEGILD